jgi:hypothetical protein
MKKTTTVRHHLRRSRKGNVGEVRRHPRIISTQINPRRLQRKIPIGANVMTIDPLTGIPRLTDDKRPRIREKGTRICPACGKNGVVIFHDTSSRWGGCRFCDFRFGERIIEEGMKEDYSHVECKLCGAVIKNSNRSYNAHAKKFHGGEVSVTQHFIKKSGDK